jgi:hypothetical protein
MTDLDAKYFENLLKETRAECRSYELPQKDEIGEAISKFPEVINGRKTAQAVAGQLKKKKKPKEEIEAADAELVRMQGEEQTRKQEILDELTPILLGFDELPHDLQVSLMKCAILYQAGPKELAKFCQEEDPTLIPELLESESIMKEMLVNGGAAKGNWGRAYKIYKEVIGLVDEDDEFAACHKRLAMAVALEHANPVEVFDSNGVFVDPVQRFIHYVEAQLRGELDPAFPYFSTWEYRYVVDSNADDEQLQWGRDHLKRYRPDQVTMGSPQWRYAMAVKSDVGYRQAAWTSSPKTYQQLVSGGGKCGPRAWYGRYICKAFGTPTWGVKQPAHAAVSRWTPNGWVTLLGGGWGNSNWQNRRGPHFQIEAHSRSFQQDLEVYFNKITLLECMAEAYEEKSAPAEKACFDPKFFWRSLVNAQSRLWSCQAKEEHFRRGPGEGMGEATCLMREYLSRKDNPKDDNVVEVLEGGTFRIPACSFSKQKKVKPFKCFEGGGQIHFEEKASELEYVIPKHVPKQEYEVICKICNVHLMHEQYQLCFEVNDENPQEAATPYTIGEWGYTKPVRVHLGDGDVLKITRKGETEDLFGLTMREIKLMPC